MIITVADTGIGIPDDRKQQIFEPFYRVDKSRSGNMGGAGIRFVTNFGTLPYTRQMTRTCVTLRNERNAKKKSTVVNDRAPISVGTMRSHR